MKNLAGRLTDQPLPSLLHQLHTENATGVLRVNARAGKHEVFVRDGFPVAVILPGSAEMLGKILVEMKFLDDAVYRKTLAEPPTKGKRYGEMLLEKGLVTDEQMRLALKAQVRRKLHRLFFLADGDFAFEPGYHEQGLQREESLRIHPSRAIYHGVRSSWNAERLAEALFLLDGRALKCKLDTEGLARYGLGTEDGRVGELLRKGYWTVADLIDAAGLPPQPVHALVYALYITEALDLRNADEVPRLKRKDAASSQNLGAPTEPARERSEVSQVRDMAELREPSGAHQMPQRDPSISGVRELSGMRKLSSGAHQMPTERRPKTTPVRGVAIQEAAHAAQPDLSTVRKQIEAKAKVVERENLFEVLSLQQTATRDDVKKAYFDAAKRYHPDRLGSMGMEALRPEVEKIFRRVSEAYGTLYDDTRRNEYKSNLGKPVQEDAEAHGKAMKLLEAEMAFRRGEVLLKKNDYIGAIRELEQAVAGNPQDGEHLAYLTWARVCAGQSTHTEAKSMLQEATRLSPKCARAYYYLGVCFKEERDMERALSNFSKSQEIDPRQIDAEREMRLINMRKEKEKTEKKGLFDRFRKPGK